MNIIFFAAKQVCYCVWCVVAMADIHSYIWGCSWRCGCFQGTADDATFDLWHSGRGAPADSACQCSNTTQS